MANLFTKKPTNALSAFLLIATVQVVAQEAHVSVAGDWFYMVKSRPSEPAREAEFNAWYEDIDIPDVLEVPGFMRARRAIARDSTELEPTDATYVALYDIDTRDIDSSIIDLYVAARKMSQLGRLTDVLKVVEANYYELVRQQTAADTNGDADGRSFVFTQKILCCQNESERAIFVDWYETVLAPALANSLGAERSQLFELYRIMEVVALTKEEIPHFLIVYEAKSDSAAQVVTEFEGLLAGLTDRGRYVGGDRVVYEIISEAYSPNDLN
jgi:hypothetical protein